MKQLTARAIILSRTDYGEADRILTLLTPEHGKIRLLAKGVRRVKSKLAGGIELFSVSHIVFIKGRGDLGTLVSTRLEKHFGTIVKDLERTMKGYELIKRLNTMTEDEAEPEYFDLLSEAFAALDDATLPLPVLDVWFGIKLLSISGHIPDLHRDNKGENLQPDMYYGFDTDAMCFVASPDNGQFGANHIKLLRLAAHVSSPSILAKVQGGSPLCKPLAMLVQTMQRHVGIAH
jgi:DNA repair protein RecO (recombination protein O)